MSSFTDKMKKRRSYRKYDNQEIDIELIIDSIEAAKHSPSGANKQPWTFCIVKDKTIKHQIRMKSEEIEKNFYKKISNTWKNDLSSLNVNTEKPFLDEASYLIVIFKHTYEIDKSGNRESVYYPDISIGISTGILISALTDYGIDILTYTPKPNDFLKNILNRPDNEKPYMILVCGKGSKDYKLPKIDKKSNEDIIKIY